MRADPIKMAAAVDRRVLGGIDGKGRDANRVGDLADALCTGKRAGHLNEDRSGIDVPAVILSCGDFLREGRAR
jgi:hypothetical protein